MSDENQQWGVAQAGYDGATLIIRYNQTAKDWFRHPELPIKLGFAVPLKSPSANGLPDPDENDQLNAIEDIIRREVEARTRGLHALVLTTGTMKEFVFYISPDADIRSLHQTIRDAVPTHDVQCMAVREPKWDSYAQFSPS
ncbi:MAG: DUF695 domain-containing protein [Aureliella sp.]